MATAIGVGTNEPSTLIGTGGTYGEAPHSGSWLGLPDFGITEALQGQPTTQTQVPISGFNQSAITPQINPNQSIIDAYNKLGWTDTAAIMADYNATGGSKLLPQATGGTPSPSPSQTTNFDDVYSTLYPGWSRLEAYNDWVAKGRPGLGSTQDQLSETQKKYNEFVSKNPYSDITPSWKPEDFEAQLNEVYNQAMQHAGKQEQYAQELKTGNIADIGQTYGTSEQALGTSKSQALGTLGQSEISSRQQQEKSLDAIRNLYNELTQGYQQRYGGASGAGEFAKAMAGKTMQQTAGQTRQATMDALRKIQTEKVNVEQNYNNSLQQLQDKRDMAIREANNNFSASMMQIERDKATAGQEKALAKMNLLKEYKTNLFNIQSQAAAYQANLNAMREQANIELDSYLKQSAASAGAGQLASTLDFGTPTSNLQIGNTPLSQAALTGQINKDELQNYLGQIGQTRTDLPLWMQR